MDTFGSALRNALEISALRNEVLNLKGVSFSKELIHPERFSHIITKNPVMIGLFRYVESISSSCQPVLILGETGSGKELFARAIHLASSADGEFVPIDVSGLDDTLFSDTLFGHTKGAYTGAEKNRPGMIEKAAGGTLFLDEIGDLNKPSQVKLLRLLQEGIYYRLGDDHPRICKARIITATNKTIEQLSGSNETFRIDLFYRLSTHLLQIPPLRERKEDLPLLVTYFAGQAAKSMNKVIDTINDSLLDCLENLPFPGNIRELKSYIYDAVAQCFSGDLSEKDIVARLNPNRTTALHGNTDYHPAIEDVFGKFPTLSELTDHAIESALNATNNNQTKAAKKLGISKQALNKRLKKKQP
jgi:transcriptional regulator with PAS, ATPase and Fis domain